MTERELTTAPVPLTTDLPSLLDPPPLPPSAPTAPLLTALLYRACPPLGSAAHSPRSLKILLDSAATAHPLGGLLHDGNLFAQQLLLGASALTMGAATLTKLAHTARRRSVHNAKATLGAVGTLAHACVWLLGLDDIAVMLATTALQAATTCTQLAVGFALPA